MALKTNTRNNDMFKMYKSRSYLFVFMTVCQQYQRMEISEGGSQCCSDLDRDSKQVNFEVFDDARQPGKGTLVSPKA